MNTSQTAYYTLTSQMRLFEPMSFLPKEEDQMDIPISFELDDIF